jgi:hypothetical protein
MTSLIRLTAVASISALALAAAACTPAADTDADNARDTDTTTIIEREVPAEPVVIEREVPAPNPPVVVEDRREGDTTTVRAGENGIEVETTNR